MINRKPVVGISLKNYQNKITQAVDYAKNIKELLGDENEVEHFFCPSMGVIYPVAKTLVGSSIGLGSQNMAPYANGAYTGEFSIESLIDMGGQYVELGHCERRGLFSESDKMIHQKIKLALEYGVTPIVCIGETEKIPEEQGDKLVELLFGQVFSSLNFISEELLVNVIIAYEPVWAVGKSLAASAPHVHKSHKIIRNTLKKLFSEEVSQQIRIIYGGSVSQENVSLIVSDEHVDGVFVGRFGHNPKRFGNIVKLVKESKEERLR